MLRPSTAVPMLFLVLLAGPVRAHLDLDTLAAAVADEAARHPGDPEAHLNAARVQRTAGAWDEALAALERAAERGADPDLVAVERGRVLLDAGRAREAKREFDGVLRRRSYAPGVLVERARAWVRLGRPDRAARDLGAAVASLPQPRPEDVFAWRDALVAAGRREQAIEALDRGIERIGPAPSLELAALDLEVEVGRHEAALRRLDRLIARSPRNAAWIARRGELLAQAGRAQEARAAWERALGVVTARPAHRRGQRVDALEERLRTALARTAVPKETSP